MNCIHHPDNAVSAYCQNCGKPLCSQCVRSVAGVIYCEPCLAAKLGVPCSRAGSYTVNVGEQRQVPIHRDGTLAVRVRRPGQIQR